MAVVNVLIVRAPGTNCALETAAAWERVAAKVTTVHLDELKRCPEMWTGAQVLTIPGGFAFGDDISAGKILAVDLSLFFGEALRAFVSRGNLVLGICNGFQVLLKAGLIPGEPLGSSSVTLTMNESGRYEDRWVHVAPGGASCPFLDDQPMYLPVAHAEGRVAVADEKSIESLEAGGRIALRYVDQRGAIGAYPVNPNGSVGSIAGLMDETGRVLGLMPHPERHAHFTHHPCWTRLRSDREPDGLRLFRNAMTYFK